MSEIQTRQSDPTIAYRRPIASADLFQSAQSDSAPFDVFLSMVREVSKPSPSIDGDSSLVSRDRSFEDDSRRDSRGTAITAEPDGRSKQTPEKQPQESVPAADSTSSTRSESNNDEPEATEAESRNETSPSPDGSQEPSESQVSDEKKAGDAQAEKKKGEEDRQEKSNVESAILDISVTTTQNVRQEAQSHDSQKATTEANHPATNELATDEATANSGNVSVPLIDAVEAAETTDEDTRSPMESSKTDDAKPQDTSFQEIEHVNELPAELTEVKEPSPHKSAPNHPDQAQEASSQGIRTSRRKRDPRRADNEQFFGSRSSPDRENPPTETPPNTAGRPGGQANIARTTAQSESAATGTAVDGRANMRIVGEDARQTVTAQSMLDTVRTRSDQDTNPQAAKVRGADAEVSNRQTVHVDRAKFVRRVAQAFEAAAERNGTVRMRLRPPELGSLRLELHLRNGVMTARLEAETPTTQRLLVEHLPALRERLIEQNIRVDRFDVDLMGNGFQQGRQETASDRRPWQAPSWNDAGGRVGNPAEGDEAVDTAAVYRRVRSTDFDVLA